MGVHSGVSQVSFPWRATVRTVFQGFIALCASWGLIVGALGVHDDIPFIASTLAVAAAVTRVMALPAVNQFIDRFLPFLAAEGKPSLGGSDVVSGPVE